MAEIPVRSRNRVERRDSVMAKAQVLLDALQERGLTVEGSYLYGSYAAERAHHDSDIDVVVISPDLTGRRVEDWCTLNSVASRIDARLEVLGFRPEQFRDEHPLVWEIKTTGIKLV